MAVDAGRRRKKHDAGEGGREGGKSGVAEKGLYGWRQGGKTGEKKLNIIPVIPSIPASGFSWNGQLEGLR